MASSESAPAPPADNVTDLGQARLARSARQSTSTAPVASDSVELDDSAASEDTASSEAVKDPKTAVKAKPARRKPGNRRFDQEKVDRLKAQIADGSYEIDPVRVADKFIEHERN